MSERPVFDQVTEVIVAAIRSALDNDTPILPILDAPDADAAREDLLQLEGLAATIADASDPISWVNALNQWRAEVEDLANHAVGSADATEALLVRVLQERYPRLATVLSLTEVIEIPTAGEASINWDNLEKLVTNPDDLINQERWELLLGATDTPEAGRLPAVLVGLILFFPHALIGLSPRALLVAPLALPPTDAPGPWRDFRIQSGEWLSVTLPFPNLALPESERVPRGMLDLVGGIIPDLSATVALRSNWRSGADGLVLDFEMWLALAVAGGRWEYGLEIGWKLVVEWGLAAAAEVAGGFGHDGEWHADVRAFITDCLPGGDGSAGELTVSFVRIDPTAAPAWALGPPGETRLVIQDAGLLVRIRDDHPVFELGGFLRDLSAILTSRWWTTFGADDDLFGDGIRFELDLDLAYVEGRGILLNFNAGLETTITREWTVLGDRDPKAKPYDLTIHSIRLRLLIASADGGINVSGEVTFNASIRVGPILLKLDGPGGWIGYSSADKFGYGYVLPTGVGLEIAAPGFTGGGFLDFGREPNPNDRFAGILHLKVAALEVVAFGVHELTGVPGQTDRKPSLILVLGIRFFPGIQLGFGFEISGVGGLVGIHRRADSDALRERLTSGAAGNVLFAEDPIRNAPAILGDLGVLFPAKRGVHVFGPTVQLSWLNVGGRRFFRFDLGVFIEFPGPARVIILGSARAEIQDASVLLSLRLDLAGTLDFHKQRIEFDAALINSRALGIFALTGTAAFRSNYGDRPYMLLSIGGFHPDFTPEPADFPKLERVALTLDKDIPSLELRFEAYLAVTNNSFQVGGALEAKVSAGSINAVGFISLDALIQFTPFYFEVTFEAGFRVRWRSRSFGGVKVRGSISGPGPIVISGKFCIELLFFDICWSDSFRIGGSSSAPAPIGSIVDALTPELTEPKNLAATGGDDRHAAQVPRGTPPRALISPIGGLTWTQKRVPLRTLVDRFEGQPLAARQTIVAEASIGTSRVIDWFAPASFVTLTESEALNRPSFERLDAGLLLGFGDASSGSIFHEVTVDEIRLPARPDPFAGLVFPFDPLVLDAVLARTALPSVRTTAPKLTVSDELFVVRVDDGSEFLDQRSKTDAYQRARVVGGGVALPKQDLVTIGSV